MIARKSVLLLLACAGTASLALASASCSTDSAGPVTGTGPGDGSPAAVLLNASCTAGGLKIAFNPMYSAYDGTHTFQVPAVVVGSDQPVTWFADSSMVGMQADGEGANEVLITMLKPGSTTIHVQSADGKCASAPLTISPAAESDWEIGNKRYNDGISVHLAGAATQEGGSPLEANGTFPACTNCHGETATHSEFTDVSHTPEQTGGFSDSDLLNIILHGQFPSLAQFDSNIVPYPAWHMFHQWSDITTDQQRGIIVYLRSLTPAPQKGAPNFGLFDMDSGMTTITTEGGTPDAASDAEEAAVDAASEAGAEAASEASIPDAAEAGASEASDDSGGGDGSDGGAASEAGDGASE